MLAEIRVNVLGGILDGDVYHVEAGTNLREWMYDSHPHGFGRPAVCVINDVMTPVEELGVLLKAGDRVEFIAPPADITTAMLTKMLISSLISVALSLVAGALLKKPRAPANQIGAARAADPVYSVTRPNNQMRLGEPVQVVYGRVITTPDLASQPYVEYSANNDQYYKAILCVGAGDVDVDDILLGDSPAKTMLSNSVKWWLYKPADHKKTIGVIEAAHNIVENMVTVSEVGSIELNGVPVGTPQKVTHTVPLTFTAPDQISGYSGAIDANTTIEIAGSASNNKTFTVVSAPGGTTPIVAKEKTVVTEVPVPGAKPSGTLNYVGWTVASDDRGSVDRLYFLRATTDWATQVEAGSLLTFDLEDNDGGLVTITGAKIAAVNHTNIDDDAAFVVIFDGMVNIGNLVKGFGPGTIAFTDGKGTTSATSITINLSTEANISQWYAASRTDVFVDHLYLDLTFPAGLYYVNHTGNYEQASVAIEIEYRLIDDDGTPMGPTTTISKTITKLSVGPVRWTESIAVPPGRYGVRVIRLSQQLNTQGMANLTWESLKSRVVNVTREVYGDVTLLAVEIKATNGVSPSSTSAIRAICHRDVHRPSTRTTAAGLHGRPDDVVYDILTNTIYGARRPPSEFDEAEFTRMRNHWGNYGRFDAVFSQKSTVWEALSLALQTVGAAPLPQGNVISLVQDGKKLARAYIFNDANIVYGTLKIKHAFQKDGSHDGVTVEYRDYDTFVVETVVWPNGALDTERVNLFGCTSRDIAEMHARLIHNKEHKLRKYVEFESELDGFILNVGDRIGVSAAMPRWGTSGSVVSVAGNSVFVDAELDWATSNPVAIFIQDDGTPSSVIPAARGVAPNEIVLAPAPAFIHGPSGSDATRFVFGNSSSMIQDYVVTQVEHIGPVTTRINAIIYDESVYDGHVLPFMEVAI